MKWLNFECNGGVIIRRKREEKPSKLNFTCYSAKYQIEVSVKKEDPEWDAFVVNCPAPHHEQTSLWGDLQCLSGWAPLRLICRKDSKIVGGVQILERPFNHFGTIGYINRGPLLAVNEPYLRESLIDSIKRTSQARRMIYLALVLSYEGHPFESTLLKTGFGIRPEMFPPTTSMKATIVVDLEPDLDEILTHLRSTTRKHIRRAEKGGLTFKAGFEADVNTFEQLLVTLCRRRGVKSNVPRGDFLQALWKAFAPKGYLRLFLTERAGEPVGGLILFTMGDWARAWRIGWSGCHDEVYPNEFIYWESIKWAKNNGYRFFDFGGFDKKYAEALITGQPIPQAEICTISFFKQGFGGKVMPLHADYCLFLSPLRRLIFNPVGVHLLNSRLFKRIADAIIRRGY